MAQDEADSDDARVVHVKYVTLQALNIDSGPWDELMWKEDNQAIVKDFLDTPATKLLILYFDRNEKLGIDTEFPKRPPMPKLMVYFLKYKNMTISMTDFKKELLCGNLTNMPLRQYQALYEQVIAPILCNPMNNKRWPKEVAKDIDLHFQDFQKVLLNCVGLAQGNTVLSIPETAKGISNIDVASLTSDSIGELHVRLVLDSIGEMVVDWTHLVNEVLEHSSEHILDKEKDQGPKSEILFWRDRKNNLEFIHSQVNDPIVKKMIIALKRTNNCYLSAFKKILQDIAEGLDEAEDIYASLASMSEDLNELETCKFRDLMELLPVAMRSITETWIQSKYLSSTPSRVYILVKKMCNLIMKRVKEYMDTKELFSDKTLNTVKLSISKYLKDVIRVFIKSFDDCRDMMQSNLPNTKLYPWKYPDQRVFDRLQKFNQRLDDIQELFEAANVYLSIPNFQINSIQQASLKSKLKTIYDEFCENYERFESSSYSPLDLDSDLFSKDCEAFYSKLEDLDCRLGAAVSQSCIICDPVEDAFQLMKDVEGLIQRPVVNLEFKSCITSLIMNVKDEIMKAKNMYETQLKLLADTGKCLTYKNLPPVSGALQWSYDLKTRLSLLMASLKKIEEYYVTSEDAHLVLELYTEIIVLLTRFEDDIFNKWTKTVSETVTTNLDSPLYTVNENKEVILNFNLEFAEAVQEIKHIKYLKREGLPYEVERFYQNSEDLLFSWSLVCSTIGWYNYLFKNLVEFEKILIRGEWEEISSFFKEGMDVKWSSPDLREYSEKIYDLGKTVFESVNRTKENIQEVVDFIKTWNTKPMYERQTPTSLVDFKIYMTPRVKEQILAVKETSIRMKQKADENLRLFKCDQGSDAWKNYISYLEDIIVTTLKDGIYCSLKYLIDNTDEENKQLAPFYKIFVSLEEDITYSPPLWGFSSGNLVSLFEAVIKQIYSLSTTIKQMIDPSADYSKRINCIPELEEAKRKLLVNVKSGAKKAVNKTEAFKPYCDLWLQDIHDILEDFLIYGPFRGTHREESDQEESSMQIDGLNMKPPTEEEFRTQITQFDLLYRKVDDMKPLIQAETWLILDANMFKERLLAIIRKWTSVYKHKLIEQKSLGKLTKIEKDEGD